MSDNDWKNFMPNDDDPTGMNKIIRDRAFRRRRAVEPEPEVDEVVEGPPKVPDLGQGGRGPGSPEPPSMNDVLRGSFAARRREVNDEIQYERRLRLRERFTPAPPGDAA